MSDTDKDLGEVYLTVPEVATKTGFSERAIYDKVRRDQIPYVKKGRSLRFSRSEIDAWMKEEQAEAAS